MPPETPPGYTQTESGLLMPVDLRASDALSDLRHPTAWLQDALASSRVNSGVRVSPQSSMALSAYYACIRVIAEDVAKLPFQVLERLQQGRNKLVDHPLWAILNAMPNNDMTAMTLREVLTHHAVGWGNGYALIERDTGGNAIGLYPVHPSRVTLRRDARVGLVYDVRMSASFDLAQINVERVRAADMLHVKGLSGDGLLGYSPAQLAAESLGLSLAAQEYGASFFGNSSTPSGILTTDGTLGDKGRENVRDAWQAAHSGVKRFGVAVLEQGLKWLPISIPPDQAQFLETRQFQVREICRWFRMQPHKIGDLADAHHTNIESQNTEHVVDTLMPWFVRWEQEVNAKLLYDEPGLYTRHDARALLRGDSTARAEYYHKQFMVGALSPNDIRELEDQNPYDGGEEYFLQIQYAPVPKIVDGTARQPRQGASRPLSPPPAAHHNGHMKDLTYAPE